MKFQDFFPVQLNEDNRNKQLLQSLLKKWSEENPQLTMSEVENIVYTEFAPKKNGLSPKSAPVFSFLSRFDGEHGNPKFDQKFLPDITKYSYKQITSLLSEYRDDDFVIPEDQVFSGKDRKATPGRIEASKNLWYGDTDAIINKDGLRVYFVPDQKESMKFGYYQQYCAEKLFNGNQWCVTGRNTSDSRTNLWGTYRPARTFWFIIDESKLDGKTPEQYKSEGLTYDTIRNGHPIKYFMSALQVVTDTNEGYRLTSFLNVGDTPMTWDQIVNIYPQLADEKEKFNFVTYRAQLEQEDNNILNRITEEENSPFEFKRQERKIKKSFLNARNPIHEIGSWKSMDEGLRDIYILNTTKEDAYDKFQKYEFIREVQKVGNQWKMLNDRLIQVGLNGVASLFDNALQKEFKIGRFSLDNKNIRLYKSKLTHLFGIYHGMYGSFLKYNGVFYEPNYALHDTAVWLDDEEKSYVVETYTDDSRQINNATFYCIFPTIYEGEMANAHFLSQSAFEKLKPRLRPSEDESFSTLDKFDAEKETDIKELEKGV
jgi:hypothetical protein